jgi:hypothetical protein
MVYADAADFFAAGFRQGRSTVPVNARKTIETGPQMRALQPSQAKRA